MPWAVRKNRFEGMTMENNVTVIKVRGKAVEVPSIHIDNKTVIVTGKLMKIAQIHDEIGCRIVSLTIMIGLLQH